MENKNTMSLHECCEAMRANLISISEDKLGQAMDEGKLPFVFSVKGKCRTVAIFRHAFYEWLDKNLG